MQRFSTIAIMISFALLAGSTAYFATKAVVLEGRVNQPTSRPGTRTSDDATSESATPTESPSASPEATPTPSTTVTPPAGGASNRLSTATQTYTVEEGDTLYPIGLQYAISWQRIAEANGLTEPYTLKIGQVLVIPTVEAGTVAILYTADPGRSQTAQAAANQGRDTWRLDPVASAQAEIGGAFGLGSDDDWRLSSRDDAAGSAVVTATMISGSATMSFEIALIQPITKGSAGVWALERVTKK